METTGRPEERADRQLVGAYQEEADSTHRSASLFQWVMRLAVNAALSPPTASCFAITTMSIAGSVVAFSLKASRTTRLIRFRSTACLATFLEIARPRRGASPPFGLAREVKNPSLERTPWRKTRVKSSARRRRDDGGNV